MLLNKSLVTKTLCCYKMYHGASSCWNVDKLQVENTSLQNAGSASGFNVEVKNGNEGISCKNLRNVMNVSNLDAVPPFRNLTIYAVTTVPLTYWMEEFDKFIYIYIQYWYSFRIPQVVKSMCQSWGLGWQSVTVIPVCGDFKTMVAMIIQHQSSEFSVGQDSTYLMMQLMVSIPICVDYRKMCKGLPQLQ